MSEKESLRIIEFLDGLGLEFQVLEHAPVFTSEQAASIRGAPLSHGVKAIVLKTGSNDFVLACVSGDKKIDLKKIKKIFGAKNVSLASPADVLEKTGCEIGSVSPFGNIFGMKTFFDVEILGKQFVEFNIGLHTKSIRMRPKDLATAVGATIAGFAKI